jgi:hypothetical protein
MHMNGPLDVHDAIHTIDYRLGLMRLLNDGSMLMRPSGSLDYFAQ